MLYALFVILTFIFIWLMKECKRPKWYPPGPPLLPIIGTWYCIPAVPRGKDIMKWRKKYGNIIGHKLGSYNIVFVSGFDEIMTGIRHPNIQARLTSEYLNIRSLNESLGLFFGNGEQWAKVRAATMRFFGQSYNDKLTNLMRQEMETLFKTIKSGEISNIDHDFMNLPVNLVSSLLIGSMVDNNRAEIQKLKYLTNLAFEENRSMGFEIFYPQLKCFKQHRWLNESSDYTHNFFTKCLEEHKNTFDSSHIRDYIDWFLLEAEKEKIAGTNHFTEKELLSCLLDILQAGNQSTGHTIIFVLMYVAMNPEVQIKIHDELDSVIDRERLPELQDKHALKYTEAVINETMRINPIAPIGVGHVVNKDTYIYGYQLPKGTFVSFALDDIFNNPEYWDEPEKFKPDRFLIAENKKKLINFGSGL